MTQFIQQLSSPSWQLYIFFFFRYILYGQFTLKSPNLLSKKYIRYTLIKFENCLGREKKVPDCRRKDKEKGGKKKEEKRKRKKLWKRKMGSDRRNILSHVQQQFQSNFKSSIIHTSRPEPPLHRHTHAFSSTPFLLFSGCIFPIVLLFFFYSFTWLTQYKIQPSQVRVSW